MYNMGLSNYEAVEVVVEARRPTLVWNLTLDIPLTLNNTVETSSVVWTVVNLDTSLEHTPGLHRVVC
jgi:hypothetical protein